MLKISTSFPIVFSKVFTKKLVKKLFHGQTISSGFLLGVVFGLELGFYGFGFGAWFFWVYIGDGLKLRPKYKPKDPKIQAPNPKTQKSKHLTQTQRNQVPNTNPKTQKSKHQTQRPKNPSTKPKPKEIKFQTQTQTPKNIWVQKKSEKTYSLKYFNINKIF